MPGQGKREAVGGLRAETQILWQGGHVTVANSGPGPGGMKGDTKYSRQKAGPGWSKVPCSPSQGGRGSKDRPRLAGKGCGGIAWGVPQRWRVGEPGWEARGQGALRSLCCPQTLGTCRQCLWAVTPEPPRLSSCGRVQGSPRAPSTHLDSQAGRALLDSKWGGVVVGGTFSGSSGKLPSSETHHNLR